LRVDGDFRLERLEVSRDGAEAGRGLVRGGLGALEEVGGGGVTCYTTEDDAAAVEEPSRVSEESEG
jgi:hypothetical protein